MVFGLMAGRWQVSDQAHVEHEQWLRGQRQQAYVDFLAAWEEAIAELRGTAVNLFNVVWEQPESGPGYYSPQAVSQVRDTVGELSNAVMKKLERVHLLGPDKLSDAASNMQGTLEAMRSGLMDMLPELSGHGDQDQDNEPMEFPLDEGLWRGWLASTNNRWVFLQAAKDVTRTAPELPRRLRLPSRLGR